MTDKKQAIIDTHILLHTLQQSRHNILEAYGNINHVVCESGHTEVTAANLALEKAISGFETEVRKYQQDLENQK